MDINRLLSEIGIEHNCKGNTYFESMGLLSADTNQKICSFLADPKYANNIGENISVLLTDQATSEKISFDGVCIVDDPRFTFFQLHNYLCEKGGYTRRDHPTEVGENSQISKLAYVADKNVKIGKNVVIEEFVSIKENVTIGDNCIIRAGTIIGGEGFEQKRHDDTVLSIHHAGGVVIGDNVELQQNNCVDRAVYPWDNTEIGDYCRTDNKVHIAHAVKLRKRVLIAACTCIAGRVVVEDDVWIGPGVTIINGIHIGKKARINIGSVATKSVPDGEAVTGNFAIKHEKYIEFLKSIR